MTINVVIERLALEGLAMNAREHDRVVSGLKEELVRLLQRDGVPGSFLAGDIAATLRASIVRAGASIEPTSLGHQIAKAVHGAVEK